MTSLTGTDRSVPVWPRYLWHPDVHIQRAEERLAFFWLIFSPSYFRDSAEAGIRAACARAGATSICAYTLLGSMDILLRVWLPRGVAEEQFRDHLVNEVEFLANMEQMSVTAPLRHFAFQDHLGHVVRPDADTIATTPSRLLTNAELFYNIGDLTQEAAARSCADSDLLADLLRHTQQHTPATITFFVTMTAPIGTSEEHIVDLGHTILQTLDEIAEAGRAAGKDDPEFPLSQLSLYRGNGYAQYLLMGRVDGARFHDLHRFLVAPVIAAVVSAPCDGRTTTYVMAQRGLLVAEERLTGISGTVTPSDIAYVLSAEPAVVEESSQPADSVDDGIELVASRFELMQGSDSPELGHGGSSEVFKVWDRYDNVHRALKLFHADAHVQALREANVLRIATHPGIPHYGFTGRIEGQERYYVAMEYIDGKTLRERLCDGRMPLDEALPIMLYILEILTYLHPDEFRRQQLEAKQEQSGLTREEADEFMDLLNGGLIHRDIKPENIMQRSSDQSVVLVDFGIATHAGEKTLTRSGTPDYMAPDAGLDKWQPADDVFACGVVLYEMLTCEVPYRDGDSRPSDPVPLRQRRSDLSLALCDAVMKAVTPWRGDRHQTASEFSAALQAADSGA